MMEMHMRETESRGQPRQKDRPDQLPGEVGLLRDTSQRNLTRCFAERCLIARVNHTPLFLNTHVVSRLPKSHICVSFSCVTVLR